MNIRRNEMITIKKLWRNDYFKSALVIGIIVAVVFGFFFGLQFILHTSVPIRVVESGSMCVPYDGACDGWLSITHPFAQTLHKGDIIIIQGVDPKDLNANYPNSDIIVYEIPTDPSATPVVHRIVAVDNINGTLYFQTKGDGNGGDGDQWPTIPPVTAYDSHTLWTTGQGIPQNLVVGKVVMRIPWFGWITLFMRENTWGLPVIVALILLLVVVEFIIPIIKSKKENPQQQTASQ
jgi:signal peptidase I